jgi:hypothetical protein
MTEEEIIAGGVAFVMGPGGDEGTRAVPPLANAAAPTMADAAEMLWVVLANVSGGDWTKQTQEWQEAAARWRDNYFAAVANAAADTRTRGRRRNDATDQSV